MLLFPNSTSNSTNFPTVKNVMGYILASITVSGGWKPSAMTMVELGSIIPCDSHLPPHCSDSRWSMSKTLLDCLQEGGAVSVIWKKYSERMRDWKAERETTVLSFCDFGIIVLRHLYWSTAEFRVNTEIASFEEIVSSANSTTVSLKLVIMEHGGEAP